MYLKVLLLNEMALYCDVTRMRGVDLENKNGNGGIGTIFSVEVMRLFVYIKLGQIRIIRR